MPPRRLERLGIRLTCSAPSCAASSSGSSGCGGLAAPWPLCAAAFGVRVVYFARTPQAPTVALGETHAEPMSLDRLLSDVRHRVDARARSLAGDAPLDRPEGHRADEAVRLSDQHVARARGGRGRACLGARSNRLLAGAALDVYEQEPIVLPGPDRPSRTCCSCPISAAPPPKRERRWPIWPARNIVAVLSGQPPLTPVTAMMRAPRPTGMRRRAYHARGSPTSITGTGTAGRREDLREQEADDRVSGPDRHAPVGAHAGRDHRGAASTRLFKRARARPRTDGEAAGAGDRGS